MLEAELNFEIDGLSMGMAYESIVRQIAGDALLQNSSAETLKETVAHDER